MTASKSKTDSTKGKSGEKGPNNAMMVAKQDQDSAALATARVVVAPSFRHGLATSQLLKCLFNGGIEEPGLGDFAEVFQAQCDAAAKGDLKFASRMLAAQATTLDAIFAETARRMASNMGDHLGAMGIYSRIAMKAQANSRATLEALAKLHQPREQTVRHVHVNEGGQAVIADQFHHHTGGTANGEISEQPHATGTVGSAAGIGAALPSPDSLGNGVPLPSREGEPALQDARREG